MQPKNGVHGPLFGVHSAGAVAGGGGHARASAGACELRGLEIGGGDAPQTKESPAFRPSPARAAAAVRRSELARQRALAPDPTAPIPVVHVGFAVRHPLIYRKRIDKVRRSPAGRPGGRLRAGPDPAGLRAVPSAERIAVRMLFAGPRAARRLPLAGAAGGGRPAPPRIFLRLDDSTNAYRLIHAEADGLPGLVVDRYGEVLSAEVSTWGCISGPRRFWPSLPPLCGTRHTLVRPSPQFLSQEGVQPPARLAGPARASDRSTNMARGSASASRAGTRRASSAISGRTASGWPSSARGRSVLDLCCYTGGFSVQAKRLGDAAEVTGVDLDEEPLQLAKENANLNQVRIHFVQADAFTLHARNARRRAGSTTSSFSIRPS